MNLRVGSLLPNKSTANEMELILEFYAALVSRRE